MNSLPRLRSEAKIDVSFQIKMLVGEELLNKARALSNRPEDELPVAAATSAPVVGCCAKAYRALVEAKGSTLPSTTSTGSGGARGRQADFRTRVHGNGNLLIGHAYTRRLDLVPGQEFKIELNKDSGTITLVPLDESPASA